MNKNSEINYEKLFNEVIEASLLNKIRGSELYIKQKKEKLKLIDGQKTRLLENKPFFLFKRAIKDWEWNLIELEERRVNIIIKIDEEINYIKNIQNKLN